MQKSILWKKPSNTLKKADGKIKLALDDFIFLTKGKHNPMPAVRSGTIKIEGDRNLAMKLQRLVGGFGKRII